MFLSWQPMQTRPFAAAGLALKPTPLLGVNDQILCPVVASSATSEFPSAFALAQER